MSPHPLFDFYPGEQLPDHPAAGNLSDADSLFVNDGYSDIEENDTYHQPQMGGQEVVLPPSHTRNEDCSLTQMTSASNAVPFEPYKGSASYDFDSSRRYIERFLSQIPTFLSDPDTTLTDGALSTGTLEILKRKPEEALEQFRSIRARVDYNERLFAQNMLGMDDDELMESMDVVEVEHRLPRDNASTDPNHIPDLPRSNKPPFDPAETTPQGGGSQDGENEKIDKWKGKAIDKGKGKSKNKGKGGAPVNPYGHISDRTHFEGDGQFSELGMNGLGIADCFSDTPRQPTVFADLHERSSGFTHQNIPYLSPYDYGGMGMAVSGGSGYSAMPVASGSGIHSDD